MKKLQDRIWHLELSGTKCLEIPLKTLEKDRKVWVKIKQDRLHQSDV